MNSTLPKDELELLGEIANKLREKNAYIIMVCNNGLRAFVVSEDIPFEDFCLAHKRVNK